MKINLMGHRRCCFSHSHDVEPLSGKHGQSKSHGKPGAPLEWETSLLTKGLIRGLGLSGDFEIEFQFQEEELRNWLAVYVEECPEKALRLLSEMQVEALINVAQKKQDNNAGV